MICKIKGKTYQILYLSIEIFISNNLMLFCHITVSLSQIFCFFQNPHDTINSGYGCKLPKYELKGQ